MTYQHKPKSEVSHAEAHTPGFEPPEHPEYSGATDIWQLSLTIACVCTGIMDPWSRQNPVGTQWDRKRPAGKLYSRELNEILAWCLTDDKNRRPKALEISKRLEETWPKVKNSLTPDFQPLVVPGVKKKPAAKAPNATSPGPKAGGGQQQPVNQNQRPGLPNHAFSDPGMQGMGQRGNQYNDLEQPRRSIMGSRTAADVMRDGGGPYGGSPHADVQPRQSIMGSRTAAEMMRDGGGPYGGSPHDGSPYGGSPYDGIPYGGGPHGGSPPPGFPGGYFAGRGLGEYYRSGYPRRRGRGRGSPFDPRYHPGSGGY